MLNLDRLLECIASTEPSSFSEICRDLGDDRPPKGDPGWRTFFRLLEQAEREGLVVVDRVRNSIASAQLTNSGADRVRARLDAKRPLFDKLP